MNREEAIGHLRNMKMPHDKFYEETDEINKALIDKGNEALGMAIEALENQKIGHWVEIDDYPHEDFECDCCGGKVYGTEEPYEEYKYCPNCGAKMAESEDKE